MSDQTGMVERVARAIVRAKHRTCCQHRPLEDFPISRFDEEEARAAIEAMREPTADMVEAGHGDVCLVADDTPCIVAIRNMWVAMVDDALSETVQNPEVGGE